jgi:hypothetical protein
MADILPFKAVMSSSVILTQVSSSNGILPEFIGPTANDEHPAQDNLLNLQRSMQTLSGREDGRIGLSDDSPLKTRRGREIFNQQLMMLVSLVLWTLVCAPFWLHRRDMRLSLKSRSKYRNTLEHSLRASREAIRKSAQSLACRTVTSQCRM